MPANSLFYTDYETLYVNFVILTSYLSLHWGTGSWWRYLFWIFISHGCPMQSSPISFPWNKYCFCHSVKSSLGIIFSSSFFQSLIDQTGTLNTESPPFIFLSQFSFTANGSCQTFLVWTNLQGISVSSLGDEQFLISISYISPQYHCLSNIL